ncbi:MAG: hydantoinase/oxoprolinase N-terminal domain-containing protein, partial [Planctomycetota bacterium]|nr:hydantoinase/oxoprolinase N-terminal domain-containing protein [Planctomycetota bacterium]
MNDGRAPTPSWKIAIDTGGTFTDAIGVDPEGRIHRTKVLSSSVLRAFTRPGPGSGTLRLALRG